ncbi:TonB-dependent receptor [Pseudothauera nasutitermitis]|uniref:TonB-dependent receptor n=1 Tax=Pseudothauera nasutitermitis TaxID=2565930 RepID=A0A4S4B1D9_9RHOO|nr:TonB-dependent receptor [Pseudothauera nasutitermitis]THF64738.1 TonB-dependent receptor [Pseudothauera nasutitermitis]
MKVRPLALACAMLAAPPVLADAVLGELSVTAKGYAADELETPAATVSLTRDELLRRGANNVGEALRGEPGLAVSGDSAQGQNPVIRGLKKESVVLLVDGIRFNSAQPAGAIASFMSLPLAERVEVVKGPASVLYGSGALGGAINVRLPQARFESGIGLDTALSWDSASRGVRATGVMNVANDDHALMLGASLARIGDYKAPGGRVDDTGYDSDSFIGQYRFRIDSANELRVSLQQHTDEDVWYPGSTKPHQNPQISRATVYSPKQERTLVEAGYRHKGSGEAPVNVDVRVYRQEMERQIFSRAYNAAGVDIGDIAQTRVAFTTDGIDARADWLAHPQHLLSFGANAWRMEASPARLMRTAPPNPAAPYARNDPFRDGRIEALGFYLQDDMRFGALNVVAGLRHDRVEGTADAVGNPPVTTGLSRTDRMWSGSLAAIYEVAPLLRPYVNLSRGVRAGEMRERFEASPRGDGYFYVGNPQIKPETATQIELGLKGADSRFEYSLAAYRTRIDDYITGLDISGTSAAIAACGAANAAACKRTINLGRATLKGFEAQGRWQFVEGHWASAGLSIVRGTNEDLDEPLFQMPADELRLGWEGRVAPEWTLDTTLRLVREQNRVATVFARGSEDKTPGFATADLGATWKRGGHSVRVAVKNLADKAYHEHLTEGVSGQEIEAPGRSLFVSYNGKF